MFVIMVYDIGDRRVRKALAIGRRYMTRVQNSVFEGEMTPGSLKALKDDMSQVIEPDNDSVIFYILGSAKYKKRELIGADRPEGSIII